MKTISEYLEEDCEKWADHPWIRTRGKEGWEDCTFREAVDAVRSISKSLLKKGLHHKNLMLCSENSREWILLYLGIMGYVGTCVPVDPTWTGYDLEHTMSVIPVSAVFYSRARKDC
ncbi:MAG: long-chain fatty acid--CoA ligase, partial [Lachnospiraceae bacterium]|nr:long-chain fatty acid--CoA ligase [Lachnospiraceae bacterium]